MEVFVLHEAHCIRFLYLCELCNAIVPKKLKLSHDETNHRLEECEYCVQKFEAKKLSLHKTGCKARPRPCLYCGGFFDLYSLINHEDTCGNRTEYCSQCGCYIKIKEYDEHINLCFLQESLYPGSLKQKPRSPPPAKKKLKKNSE